MLPASADLYDQIAWQSHNLIRNSCSKAVINFLKPNGWQCFQFVVYALQEHDPVFYPRSAKDLPEVHHRELQKEAVLQLYLTLQ